jgi:hypothetical protein
MGESEAIDQATVSPATSPYATSFPFTKRTEQQLAVRADLVRTPGQFEDPILWRLFTSGLSTRFYNAPMPLTAVAPDTGGSLTVRLKGSTDLMPNRYYHRASIQLNGTLLGYIDFEGLEGKTATFPVAPGLWASGNNTVRIDSAPPPGTSFDSFYLDYIEADYQRTLTPEQGQLTAIATNSSLLMSGFSTDNLDVWDVSDPWLPKRLTGYATSFDGTSWNVSATVEPGSVIAATLVGGEKSPVQIALASDIDLRASDWEVDHLTISCPDLMSAASNLTDYRNAMGLQAEIISVDDIYDEFNYGIRDPRAIRNFLAYTYHHWTLSPRYVVLVGDGSFDYKNDIGFGDSRIPGFPVIVGNGLYVSDYPYGDILGDGYLQMAVGRIPLNSSNDIAHYIEKLIAYETGGLWRNNTLISTDLSDYAGNYIEDGNAIEQTISFERDVIRADMDILGAEETREQLLAGLNVGKEVAVYIGHGTAQALSLQSILVTADTASLTNKTAPTAFIGLGCLIGTFGGPGQISIGEGFIAAEGGAVSMVAAATLISVADGRVITDAIVDSLYLEGEDRMGDAWIAGKNALTMAGRVPAYNGFQFLGDPGLAKGSPTSPRGEPSSTSVPGEETYTSWVDRVFPPVMLDLGVSTAPEDDPDQDGSTNEQEFKAGTDPFNAQSVLRVQSLNRQPNGLMNVAWPSVAGRSYQLEWSSHIDGPYFLLQEGIEATAPINELPVTLSAGDAVFFRVAIP